MKENLINEAKKHMEAGFSIIPVNISLDKKGKYQKKPLVRWQDYQKVQATEFELNKWKELKNFNGLGLVTGKISGVVVLDIDDPSLVEKLELPATPTVKSISGGYHYYFKFPDNLDVKNHQSLLPHIDIRGEGGFIVVPPSGIDDEHCYKWEVSPRDEFIAKMPDWLVELIETAQSPELSKDAFDPDKMIDTGLRHKAALQAIGHFSNKYKNEGLDKIWGRLADWSKFKFTEPFDSANMSWFKLSFDRYAPRNIAKNSGKASSRLIQLILGGTFSLFKTTKDKKTYIGRADQPLIVIPTDSEDFYDAISLEYYSQYNNPLTKDAVKKVMPTIRALIFKEGEEIELNNRIAMKDGVIYYDLFEDNFFVRISPNDVDLVGPDVIRSSGIRFVRYSHQEKQCIPTLDVPIEETYNLFEFLAIKDEEQKQLLLSHLVASLIPNIPRCMLVFHGSRGSSKSTSQRIIKSLIDPASPALLRIPKSDDDLQIYLEKNYFCCFDNVSYISKEVSDSLCMMITGGGTLKRKLYTDNEIVTTNLKSCLALNGINLAIREPDLLERSLIIETRRLDSIKSEDELTSDFEKMKSIILGGLFSLLSQSLQNLPEQAAGTFRMADYYKYASSAAVSLGSSREDFEKMFQRNIDRQNEAAIESSPLAQVVVEYMSDKMIPCEEKASDLYTIFNEKGKEMGFAKGMPNGAHNLWKKLRPIQVDLEAVGILIERVKRRDATYLRITNKNVSVEAAEAVDADNEAFDF